LLKSNDFYLSGNLAILYYLLNKECEKTNGLLGKEKNDCAEVSMWLNHITYNIWPFYGHIIGQITGLVPNNGEVFKTACDDLMGMLGKINETLKFKSFLIGTSLTLADLFLAASLHPYFTMVFTEDCRKKIPNVTRLYLFASSIKQYQQVYGRPLLCKVSQKPSELPIPSRKVEEVKPSEQKDQGKAKDNKTKEQAKGKPEAKPKDDKPKEIKPKEEKPKEEKPKAEPKEESQDISEEPKLPKKSNPLDQLPPSKFELDPFKKEFLNTKEKKKVLDEFWNKFDPEGYSIWFVHYNKSGDQGKLAFKTKNLRSNFLQKIDKFRKYTFSVHGVYGKEPDLEIEGVWMWRGKDVPEEVKLNNHSSLSMKLTNSLL
jgi:elongation factor 1-gamma